MPSNMTRLSEVRKIPNSRPQCPSTSDIGYFGNCTFSLSRASLMGRVVREMDAVGWGVFSAMAAVCASAIDGFNSALGVLEVRWRAVRRGC